MTRFAFETMLELVGVEPLSGYPGNSRRLALVLQLRLCRFDDVFHSRLFAKPAEVIIRMCKRIVDNLSKQVKRGAAYFEVEDAIVKSLVIGGYQSKDIP